MPLNATNFAIAFIQLLPLAAQDLGVKKMKRFTFIIKSLKLLYFADCIH